MLLSDEIEQRGFLPLAAAFGAVPIVGLAPVASAERVPVLHGQITRGAFSPDPEAGGAYYRVVAEPRLW